MTAFAFDGIAIDGFAFDGFSFDDAVLDRVSLRPTTQRLMAQRSTTFEPRPSDNGTASDGRRLAVGGAPFDATSDKIAISKSGLCFINVAL